MKHLHPAKILVLGYLLYSIVGCLILSLPICHVDYIGLLDTYFTAISAVSTTGLATIDIGSKYNLLGQIVILLLIQLGGVGYMTFSSFILLCTSQKLSAHRKRIGASSFAFPKDFSIQEFIYSLVIFSFLCELLGAMALSVVFWHKGIEEWMWNGIFHSISAFCTAGLSLFSDGLVGFQESIACNLIFAILAILGSLGFIVSLDFYKKWTETNHSLSFTTRVILTITCLFLTLGTLSFFAIETLTDEGSLFQEAMIGFFQVMSAMTTTGFNTVDIGTLTPAILILLAFLSTFGSSPSGTGGGLKNTAFASLVAFVKSTLKGKPTTLWHHIIPKGRVKIATVAFIYYVFCLSITLFFLSLSEHQPSLDIFFEAANALNNSGLSTGLTEKLSSIGKILIALLMLMGRVGVLTFGVAISSQKKETAVLSKKTELIT
jgi:Trk-type K+ transport systems, membrane components